MPKKDSILEADVKAHFWRYFLPLLFVGLINNNGYVLVGTKAQELAKSFHQEKFMAAFQFMLIFFNLFIRAFNMKYFIKFKHTSRIIVNTIILMSAYTIIAITSRYESITAFVFALIASSLMGAGSCFGESTVLGYLKGFPAVVVVGWGSGTGFAGVFGAGISILLKLKLNTFYLCLGCLPLCLLYVGLFFLIVYRKNKLLANATDETKPLTNEPHSANEAIFNDNLKWVNIKAVLPKIYFFCINLASVYFLEYSIMTAYGDHTTKMLKKVDNNYNSFLVENAYMFICLSYQIGVVISRSSLKLIQVKKVQIITLLQYINWCLWLLEAFNMIVTNYYILFVHMVFVGLMGGCQYVNVMFLILNSEDLNINQKELAINMTTFFDDIGITLSSILSIIFASVMKV